MISVELPWKPHAKQRPRSGRGHTYTPTPTKNAEKAIVAAFREALPDHEPIEGPISVKLGLYDDRFLFEVYESPPWLSRKLRGDLDNYEKTILDALNGHAWVDDKQIGCLYGWKA
jgi:Holliday junction resolvase RusA-like endonuclease